MVKFSHLYQNEVKLNQFMQNYYMYKNYNLLVKIITSTGDKTEAHKIASSVKTFFPNSSIFGASSSEAVLYCGEQLENSVVLIFEYFETLDFKLEVFSHSLVPPEELAQTIYEAYSQDIAGATNPLHVIFAGEFDVYRFILDFNKFSPIIKLAGGVAGNHHELTGGHGFIFNEDGILDDCVFTYAVVGHTYDYMSVSTSQEPISPIYKITKTKDNCIDEIDNKPALRWMYDFLKLTKTDDFTDWKATANNDYLVHFPLILEDDGSGRFTKVDKKTGKLGLYTPELFEGTEFRVGYVNPERVVQDTYAICADILDTPAESLFAYTCYFRKLFLKNCALWETTPFSNYDICGLFLMGEIAYSNGENALHNGSYIFTSVAEKEKYILPDYIALENAEFVGGDDTFLIKAQSMQRDSITENFTGSALLSAIKKKEVFNSSEKYIDKDLGLPNIYKFEEDHKEYNFEKLAFVESQTADATIAFAGQETFFESTRELLQQFNHIASTQMAEYKLHVYLLNYKTVVLTTANKDITDEQFIECCNNLYGDFGYATSQKTEVTSVSRVLILLNQEKPIELGMNLLLKTKDSQDTFIICDSDYYQDQNSNPVDELRIIELLKRALDKDLITPFYQGIYNNALGCIDKYEALMRIVDLDGKVYSPYVFLDLAKKYKFYNNVSKLMIEKVLKDFENRKESVSINISKYDIVSSTFRHWLLEKLRHFPQAERVVVEFLETEDITQADVLLSFIEQIRKLGAKIAIDDFGAGYSTFTTIVALKPNFIKIDGSIIKDLVHNEDNQIILDAICYLAKRMQVEIVAEFVENEQIQLYLYENEVNYSQGYYFSQPKPLQEL